MKTKYYQLLTEDICGYPVLQQFFTDEAEAEKEKKSCESCWPNSEWWIEEGTEYIAHKCRGCGTPEANEQCDAHGIPTGYWCEPCYESDKYPYRRDRYPTMETHGYGERLDDDY